MLFNHSDNIVILLFISLALQSCGFEQVETDDSLRDAGWLDDDADSPGADLIISNLKVEPNPRSAISCYVSWDTNLRSSSMVEFGEDSYEFRIRDVTLSKHHRILVIGMHAKTEYSIRAVSKTADFKNVAGVRTSYTTGELPMFVPVGKVGDFDPDAVQPGWTLTNISNISKSAEFPPVAVMYDFSGQPVWYYINGHKADDRGDIYVGLLESKNVIMSASRVTNPVEIDLGGNVIWEGPEQGPPNYMHHYFGKLDNGDYIALRKIAPDEYCQVSGDLLQQLSPTLDVVWTWNIFDHVEVDPEAEGDWSHCNSVTVDLDRDVFYLGCRNLDAVFKVNRGGDQNVIWQLGKGGTLEKDPSSDTPWFTNQHEPELQKNGNILIYDNGYSRRRHTRVVEYEIDEEAGKSFIVWEFPGSFDVDRWYTDEWFSDIWGDADRQENGNTLITAGTRTPGQHSRIFEVTPEGVVVWEMTLPRDGDFPLGVYQSERVSPPLVEPVL